MLRGPIESAAISSRLSILTNYNFALEIFLGTKAFRLTAEQIAPISLGVGGCLATDRILVDGCPAGYMYRERPHDEQDSGWRFFAGDEDETYMAPILSITTFMT